MTDTKKANRLLKAAKGGDVGSVRELLAAGVPIEATDPNRMTAVQLAAQAGHAEAFHALVAAGANLDHLALDQTDTLECAAEGGNVAIVRFLLELGHPAEGHWRPRGPADRRQGHIGPLMSAAINGHVEAVRVLLDAGADRAAKFDGETALKMVEGSIKHPLDGDAEKKPRFQAIVAMLSGSAADESPIDAANSEVENFAKNARGAAYRKLRQSLEKQCGPARPWKPVPDHGRPAAEVVRFTLAGCDRPEVLEKLRDDARKSKCHLVLAEPWIGGEDAVLILFPTDDKYAVLAAIGTEGANYSVTTTEIIRQLAEMEEANPFELVYCGHDLIGGTFHRSVKGATDLAERLVELCPCILDEGVETADELAAALKKQKSFLLRWD